jgi:5-carboxymethyl-2-hydroxymuconate isomerase
MKKHITMTYIEVLEKRLERKRERLAETTNQLEVLPTSTSKIHQRKYLELEAEIRELESCLDLAKVMFDGENEKEPTGSKDNS